MAKHNVSMGLLLALLGSLIVGAQASSPPKKPMIPDKDAYLGQTPPGDAAQVFAPDVVSTATCFAQNVVFTPDGRELYFTITNGQWDTFAIWYMAFKEDRWTTPIKADFLGLLTSV